MLSGPNAPRARALRGFGRGLLQLGPKSGNEPELRPETPSLAHVLRERGYEVGYKGKWHLTHPDGDGPLLAGWAESDADRLHRDYGFADWEPPDAGENAKAEHFGAGNAGPLGNGWDEIYTQQVESWLGRADLPEPFCLVVSLVNPHDVLGYPAQHVKGGYRASDFRDLGVGPPPTLAEDLRDKPTVHELMKMGMAAYLGPLRGEQAKLDYVNFYAHLHRVVDEKLGRVLAALGDPGDPGSLRSRTLIFRCADHGEMGLSHGGLRQKAFNAYEETIHIPLVVSNPVLFPKPVETDALASLVDVLPTIAKRRGSATRRRGQGPRPLPRARRQGRPRGRAPAEDRRRSEPRHGASRAGGIGPGRDPLHVRRPPGGDRASERPGPAQSHPCDPHGRREVRALLRPDRKGILRVRDVRPGPGSAGEPEPGRPRRRRAPRDDHRALRSELGERLRGLMAANGTGPVPSSDAVRRRPGCATRGARWR